MIRSLYQRIYSRLFGSRIFKYRYLKLATMLATRGITPPFSPRAGSTLGQWEQQGTREGLPKPATYVHEDRSITELFQEVLPHLVKESPILEIGCNVGRALNHLYLQGFRNLTGIEIGSRAVELMKTTFPEMHRSSRIIVGDAATVIKDLPTAGYDLVFCHSVLVNIHPKYDSLFDDMARVCRKYILVLENEGSYTAYPRDFQRIFERRGYKMIVSKVFSTACSSLPAPFTDEHLFANNTIRLFVQDLSRPCADRTLCR